jgi:hypothetical protein
MKIIKVKSKSEIPKDFTGIAEYPNGSKQWYLNGKLDRENDLPAIEHSYGHKAWYLNGKRHRENDLPAIEFANGRKEWYLNGLYHRETGPAVELTDGTKYWWLNGQKYLETDWKKEIEKLKMNKTIQVKSILEIPKNFTGVAEFADGSKQWFLNGNYHKENGPAVESSYGSKYWWLNGQEYSEEDWKKKVFVPNKKTKSKWHTKEITKGTLGELSKIQEELDEASDALAQDQKLMLMFELSDICGACGLVAEKHGFTLDDLVAFSNLRTQVIKQEIEEKNAKKT